MMWNPKMVWAVALILLSSGAIADEDHAEAAKELTEASFKSAVGTKPHFVMFFAPWCGHCKRLAPAWQDLAKALNPEGEVVVAKVDCTVETALCSDQNVTGYPTLKFFKSGADSGTKHRGQRDLDSLKAFVDEQMGRAPSKEEELASQPEEPVVENGLYVLNAKSFAKHIEKGSHFVKFYAPWCGHCKKLAPTWDDLAKTVDKDESITAKIAKLDCTKAQDVCQENGVKGYPTLTFFKDGVKVETYSGARTLKDLKDFVASMVEEPGKPKDQSADAVPTEDGGKQHVILADHETFDEVIKSGFSFVKFFAPWCGHCKRLAPTWEELAAHYAGEEDSNLRIVKVDCTSNDNKNKDLCNTQGVNGFPTLNLYKDGEKIKEYNGKRGLSELQDFIKANMKTEKDEL